MTQELTQSGVNSHKSTGHTKSTSLDVISSLVTSHVGLNVTFLSDTGSWKKRSLGKALTTSEFSQRAVRGHKNLHSFITTHCLLNNLNSHSLQNSILIQKKIPEL
jgi:hypothetical protein